MSVAQTKNLSKKRDRLAPEQRREMMLDVAAHIIVNEGVSAVKMDRLGVEAGVSKSLVYNYYPNRLSLLRALLVREYKTIEEILFEASKSSKTFESLVRRTTRIELQTRKYQYTVIRRLTNEPSIADVMSEVGEKYRRTHVQYLTSRIVEATGLPEDIAFVTTELNLGISNAAVQHLDSPEIDIQFVEDTIVDMVLANVAFMAKKYGSNS